MASPGVGALVGRARDVVRTATRATAVPGPQATRPTPPVVGGKRPAADRGGGTCKTKARPARRAGFPGTGAGTWRDPWTRPAERHVLWASRLRPARPSSLFGPRIHRSGKLTDGSFAIAQSPGHGHGRHVDSARRVPDPQSAGRRRERTRHISSGRTCPRVRAASSATHRATSSLPRVAGRPSANTTRPPPPLGAPQLPSLPRGPESTRPLHGAGSAAETAGLAAHTPRARDPPGAVRAAGGGLALVPRCPPSQVDALQLPGPPRPPLVLVPETEGNVLLCLGRRLGPGRGASGTPLGPRTPTRPSLRGARPTSSPGAGWGSTPHRCRGEERRLSRRRPTVAGKTSVPL